MQKNGVPWIDTQGNDIQAHGGYILQYDGYYYLYGEDRRGSSYVSCYRSTDLTNWEKRNICLHTGSRTEAIRQRTDLHLTRDDGCKVNIERPKVLYCEKTGKFMMWAHYENGRDYKQAAICIASCDTPDEDFTYHGSFNPYGYMSRDCTLFRDDDGKTYFISAARDNADLHIYLLTDDMLNVKKHVNTLFQGEYREAPAMFKRNGRYYLLTSHCTGWAPNQGKYSIGDAIDGEFTELRDFGDETTFHSQPAFVLTVNGQYIYFGDRWCYHPDKALQVTAEERLAYYTRSTFVVLPICFDSDKPYIVYQSEYSYL